MHGYSKSSQPPSREREEKISSLARPHSFGAASPPAARKTPCSKSLMNLLDDDASSSRRDERSTAKADRSDDADDRIGQIQCMSSNVSKTSALQKFRTRSKTESVAALNLGNQRNRSNTNPTEVIPLKNISSGFRSSSYSRLVSFNASQAPRYNSPTYASHPDLSSPEEMPPTPTTVTVEIHNQPIDTANVPHPHQQEPSRIPGSSLETRPDRENLSQLQLNRSRFDEIQVIESLAQVETQCTFDSNPPASLPTFSELLSIVYVKLEVFVWFFVFSWLFCLLLPKKLDMERYREVAFPSYSYELTRAICIDGKIYHTLNCLQKNETKYLTNSFIHNDCLFHLKRAFREEFCLKNLLPPNAFHNRQNGYSDGAFFFLKLTGSNDTTKKDNVLKYMTCVRVFEKNPFGEVKVIRKGIKPEHPIIQHDLRLNNYKLMIECDFISPDSFFDFFKNQENVYSVVKWVFGTESAFMLIWIFIRFHIAASNIILTPSSRSTAPPPADTAL